MYRRILPCFNARGAVFSFILCGGNVIRGSPIPFRRDSGEEKYSGMGEIDGNVPTKLQCSPLCSSSALSVEVLHYGGIEVPIE